MLFPMFCPIFAYIFVFVFFLFLLQKQTKKNEKNKIVKSIDILTSIFVLYNLFLGVIFCLTLTYDYHKGINSRTTRIFIWCLPIFIFFFLFSFFLCVCCFCKQKKRCFSSELRFCERAKKKQVMCCFLVNVTYLLWVHTHIYHVTIQAKNKKHNKKNENTQIQRA